MRTVYYCPICGDGQLWDPLPPYCPSHEKEVKAAQFIKTYIPDGQQGILDYRLGYTHTK